MAAFSIYILYSTKVDKYYVGESEDVAARLSHIGLGYLINSKEADWNGLVKPLR